MKNEQHILDRFPQIGVLCRNGKNVYYIIQPNGDVKEGASALELVAPLANREVRSNPMRHADFEYRAGILLEASRQQMAEARTDSQRREAACRLRAMRSIVKAN